MTANPKPSTVLSFKLEKIAATRAQVKTVGLSILAKEQLIASKYAKEAFKKYKIDQDKPIPTKL